MDNKTSKKNWLTSETPLIAPSLLSADFTNLSSSMALIEDEVDIWHFDAMDGHFVENISFGPPILKAVRKLSAKPIDAHLMLSRPQDYLEAFAKAGADGISIHVEVATHGHALVAKLHDLGVKAGVVLNPATSLEAIREYLPLVDYVLLMSVNPGFGGQSFIPQTLDKIRRLKSWIDDLGLDVRIEVDGGINRHNLPDVLEAGADLIVAGSAIFGAPDPLEELRTMKDLARQAAKAR